MPDQIEQASWAVFIPTFRRRDGLRRVVTSVLEQSHRPIAIAIYDSADQEEVAIDVSQWQTQNPEIAWHYYASGFNGGPAGAGYVLMPWLIEHTKADWIARLDDDRELWGSDVAADLFLFASRERSLDSQVGAVGYAGASLERRAGRFRQDQSRACGWTEVDYLAGGMFSAVARDAIGELGAYRPEFFWGWEEVEYGLRLKASGYRLLRFDPPGRMRGTVQRSRRITEVNWRRYYTVRNTIWTLKEYRCFAGALNRTFTMVGKAVLGLLTFQHQSIRFAVFTGRGVWDGWFGRLGRTLEPEITTQGDLAET